MKIDCKLKIENLIFVFVIWRLLLFLPLWLTKDVPFRQGYEYANIFTSTLRYSPVDSPLLNPWANFDGVHYLDISGNGYKDNGQFFPLLPLTIRGLAAFFGTGQVFGAIQFFSGLLITNLSFLLAIIFLYKLLRLDFSEKISFWSVIFLIFFPTSFFYTTVYSESLFLLLLVLSFYFARKKDWFLSAVCAMLLSITRPIGLLIIPALIYEYYRGRKILIFDLSFLFLIFNFLFLIPLGLVLFSVYCLLKWHDPLYFLHAQALVKNGRTVTGFVFPLQTIFRYIKIFLTVSPKIYEFWIAIVEFVSFGLASFLLVVAWLKRVRPSYLLFSTLAFFVPILSGTFSGLPRYIIVLFPIFIPLTFIKNKLVIVGLLAIGLLLQLVFLGLFSRGYFIA